MKHSFYPVFILILLSWMACTPKTTEVAVPKTPPIPEPPKNEELSPCKKFSDVSHGDDLLQDYVVYRDFYKLKKYDEAFPLWSKVYKEAPAADGRRWTVYSDGIVMYQDRLRKEPDSAKHDAIIDEILSLYDGIATCYPEQETYVRARKAFDLYYNYPSRSTDMERYDKFKSVIDEKGMDTYVFVLNPFTKLMVDGYINEVIPREEAQHYAELIPEIIQHNVAKGKDIKSWHTVRDYAIPYIERLEADKGFFDCDYFMDKYYNSIEEDPTNCDLLTDVYGKLRFGGCAKEDDRLKSLYQSMVDQQCLKVEVAGTGGVVREGYALLRDGSYRPAVAKFKEALEATDDPLKKAKINMLIAKIFYAHLKDYHQARSYARQAAKLNPSDGSPYILIGKLYASSGPLCGPGRGFDSQVVTWPAIDQWQQAKRVDNTVAGEANQLIRKYSAYMPSKEDIFQRSLTEGQTYKVGCWIGETTTIRTAK